jgi:hypothetical protein
MSTLKGLSRIVERRSTHDGALRCVVGEGWPQGRPCCGGLIATPAVQAMRKKAGGARTRDVRLRALQTRFVGPVAPGALAACGYQVVAVFA